MVDSGISEGEDSDDGGFDVRWWLMRENRRFEASGGRPKSRHFSGQIGRRNRFNLPGFCFIWGYKPLCGFSEASNGRKWEIGWERENRRREERETPRFSTVWTRTLCTGASEGREPLDRGWTDPAAVIGWICKLIDSPDGLMCDLVWRGVPRSWYTGWRGATRSKDKLF
jgi:hypothetical protein